MDSGLGPSTLIRGFGLAWWRPGWNLVGYPSPLFFLQVEILPQGRESPIFKQFFKDWK